MYFFPQLHIFHSKRVRLSVCYSLSESGKNVIPEITLAGYDILAKYMNSFQHFFLVFSFSRE